MAFWVGAEWSAVHIDLPGSGDVACGMPGACWRLAAGGSRRAELRCWLSPLLQGTPEENAAFYFETCKQLHHKLK